MRCHLILALANGFMMGVILPDMEIMRSICPIIAGLI